RKYVDDLIAAITSNTPNDTIVLPILRDVTRIADVKKFVTTQMEDKEVDLCERLVDADPERRSSAIKLAVVADAESAPGLLLFTIEHDPEPRVRGMCLSQLAFLKRYEELGTVLKMPKHED